MKRMVLVVLAAACLLFDITKQVQAENDWEYRSSYELRGAVNDALSLKVAPELRYNNDFSNHYYTHLEMGLDWKARDWLILGMYYRHVNESKQSDWQAEYRPHLNVTFQWKMLGLGLSDRNRLEYRILEDKEFFRYANKLTVKLPRFTRFEIQPYLAEEPFYDFDAQDLNKNCLYAGVDFKIVKALKAGIYYMLESRKKADDWTDVNVLGTALKYSF